MPQVVAESPVIVPRQKMLALPPIPVFVGLNGADLLYLAEQTGVEVIEPKVKSIAEKVRGEGNNIVRAMDLVDLGPELPAMPIGLEYQADWCALFSLAVDLRVNLPEMEMIIAANALIGDGDDARVGTLLQSLNGKRRIGTIPASAPSLGRRWLVVNPAPWFKCTIGLSVQYPLPNCY